MEQTSLDYTLKLYNAMLDDMINIFADQFMEKVPKSKLEEIMKKDIQYKLSLLKSLMKDVTVRFTSENLENINSFFDSVLNAFNGKDDDISRKKEISIIVYCYCLIDTFNYLVRKKSQDLFQLDQDKYKNLQIFIYNRGLEKYLKAILTNFSVEIKKKKDKDIDISATILKVAKDGNFKNYKIDNEQSQLKSNLKENTINNIKEEINIEKGNKNNKNNGNMKAGDDLSEGETTENTIIENENLISLLNSIEMDLKFNLILSKIKKLEESNKKLEESNKKLEESNKKFEEAKKKLEREIESLKVKDSELENKCELLKGDIDKLWNYFNLISNGRDITKSIVFYLYDHFGLSGEYKNNKKLSQIIDLLNNQKNVNKENAVEKDKLEKFLYLNYFLYKFYSKIVHRDAKNPIAESGKIKILGKYEFSEYFQNLIIFLNKTIKHKGIQTIINQTIVDYKKESIPKNLEYKKDNLFIENNGILEAILTEQDIREIFSYLKNIKIKDKNFATLCEDKMWNNNEF